jgi:energy-coupling factor transport system permease protein
MSDARHPLAKLLAAFLAIAVLTLTETPAVLIATLVATLCLILASGAMGFRRLALMLAPFVFFALASSWIYLVAESPAHAALAGGGRQAALIVFCRVLAVGAASVAFAAATDPSALARALTQQLGFPRRFVHGALAAIQFMPALIEDYRMARLTALSALDPAPASGWFVRRWRVFIAGRTPETGLLLMAAALRRAGDAALSMQLRGLSAARPRGGWRRQPFGWRDAALPGAVALWFCLIFPLARAMA